MWGQISGIIQIILMRREHFRETFGIEYEAFFEEFLNLIERSIFTD